MKSLFLILLILIPPDTTELIKVEQRGHTLEVTLDRDYEDAYCYLYTWRGKPVADIPIKYKAYIDISKLKPGKYILEIVNPFEEITQKVVRIRKVKKESLTQN